MSKEYYFWQNFSVIDSFISINDQNNRNHNAAVQTTKDIAEHYSEPILEAL